MDLFCKESSYENFRSLKDIQKYAFFSKEVQLGKLKNMFVSYLFRYRKEEEMKLFDICTDIANTSKEYISLTCFTNTGEDDEIVFSFVKIDGIVKFEIAHPFGEGTMHTCTDIEEGRFRFQECFKYIVIDSIQMFSHGKYDGDNLYTRKSGLIMKKKKKDNKKDKKKDKKKNKLSKVPSIYKQDKKVISLIQKYGVFIGNRIYENYMNEKHLNIMFADNDSKMLEQQLKTLISPYSKQVEFFSVVWEEKERKLELKQEKSLFSIDCAVKFFLENRLYTIAYLSRKILRVLYPDIKNKEKMDEKEIVIFNEKEDIVFSCENNWNSLYTTDGYSIDIEDRGARLFMAILSFMYALQSAEDKKEDKKITERNKRIREHIMSITSGREQKFADTTIDYFVDVYNFLVDQFTKEGTTDAQIQSQIRKTLKGNEIVSEVWSKAMDNYERNKKSKTDKIVIIKNDFSSPTSISDEILIRLNNALDYVILEIVACTDGIYDRKIRKTDVFDCIKRDGDLFRIFENSDLL